MKVNKVAYIIIVYLLNFSVNSHILRKNAFVLGKKGKKGINGVPCFGMRFMRK